MRKPSSNGVITSSLGGSLNFSYSPSNFSRSGGSSYSEISAPGSLSPSFYFCKGNATTISLEFSVILDTFKRDKSSSYNSFDNFFRKCCPTGNPKVAETTPIVTLSLGEKGVYKGILTDYSSDISRYNEEMEPIEFSISFSMTCVGG